MAQVPYIFATLPGGLVPASYLDANFAAVNPPVLYGTDTGSVNTLNITVPVPSSVVSLANLTGYLFQVVPAFANTGAATIEVNGYPSVPVLEYDGTTLQPYALRAGVLALMACQGTSMVVLSVGGPVYFNAPSGYVGDLLNLKLNGTTVLSVDQAGNLAGQLNITNSLSPAVTAAGTTQGTATTLTSTWNVVTTNASGTGVILQTTPTGTAIRVFHAASGGNILSVYPPAGHTIFSLTTNSPAGMIENQVNDFCYLGSNLWMVK